MGREKNQHPNQLRQQDGIRAMDVLTVGNRPICNTPAHTVSPARLCLASAYRARMSGDPGPSDMVLPLLVLAFVICVILALTPLHSKLAAHSGAGHPETESEFLSGRACVGSGTRSEADRLAYALSRSAV